MIIVQISDSHIAADHPEGAARAATLERCVADINGLDPRPDAVIHTGDIAQSGRPEEYEAAWAILEGLRAPFYLAAGNRDSKAALLASFAGRLAPLGPDMPFVQYAVDLGSLRLIALDTRSEASNKGSYCAERLSHLNALLAEDESKPVAAFMHHPPFDIPAMPDPFQFETREAAEGLAKLLSDGGRVIRAFCGHAHRAASGAIGAVPASTVPSLAADLRKGEYPDGAGAAPLYQIHRFDGAGSFVTELRVVPVP